MTSRRLPWKARSLVGTWIFSLGCAALNFEEPGPTVLDPGSAPAASMAAEPVAERATAKGPGPDAPSSAPTPSEASPKATAEAPTSGGTSTEASRRRSTPTRVRLDQQQSARKGEVAKDWRALAREARELAQRGRYDRATELLEQAALQLKDRRPTSTPRRTVYGLRARHAIFLAARGETEKADALADRLFDEVRAEPALADRALVDLARSTAERRKLAAKEAGRTESQLPLLALALEAAQSGTASRERLGLAFQVSNLALRADDLDLARRAIDQAIFDARTVAPNDRIQAAALEIYRARIALSARDLATAEASSEKARRIFEEADADSSNRGVADATLAQVLAEKGEAERALKLARSAYARITAGEKLVDHARRQIVAALARVERLAGDAEAAGGHYREALSVPADGSDVDEDLIRTVKSAIAELEAPTAASASSGS